MNATLCLNGPRTRLTRKAVLGGDAAQALPGTWIKASFRRVRASTKQPKPIGRSEALATDRGALEASLGTELSNSFDDGQPPTPGRTELRTGRIGPFRDLVVRAVRRERRRRGRQSRSLCRGASQSQGPFGNPIDPRHHRPRRPVDRANLDRFDRRKWLFYEVPR